jgi:hypothetical protein
VLDPRTIVALEKRGRAALQKIQHAGDIQPGLARIPPETSLTATVADYSKINRFNRIAIDAADCIDALITNAGADPSELDALRAMGVEIIAI